MGGAAPGERPMKDSIENTPERMFAWLKRSLLTRGADPQELATKTDLSGLRQYGLEAGILVPSRKRRREERVTGKDPSDRTQPPPACGLARDIAAPGKKTQRTAMMASSSALRAIAEKRMAERCGKHKLEPDLEVQASFGVVGLHSAPGVGVSSRPPSRPQSRPRSRPRSRPTHQLWVHLIEETRLLHSNPYSNPIEGAPYEAEPPSLET